MPLLRVNEKCGYIVWYVKIEDRFIRILPSDLLPASLAFVGFEKPLNEVKLYSKFDY